MYVSFSTAFLRFAVFYFSLLIARKPLKRGSRPYRRVCVLSCKTHHEANDSSEEKVASWPHQAGDRRGFPLGGLLKRWGSADPENDRWSNSAWSRNTGRSVRDYSKLRGIEVTHLPVVCHQLRRPSAHQKDKWGWTLYLPRLLLASQNGSEPAQETMWALGTPFHFF